MSLYIDPWTHHDLHLNLHWQKAWSVAKAPEAVGQILRLVAKQFGFKPQRIMETDGNRWIQMETAPAHWSSWSFSGIPSQEMDFGCAFRHQRFQRFQRYCMDPWIHGSMDGPSLSSWMASIKGTPQHGQLPILRSWHGDIWYLFSTPRSSAAAFFP